MKKLIWSLPLAASLAAGAVMIISAGCSNQTTTTPGAAPATNAAATNSVTYTCSMHPEIVTNQPGNCPICGMKLVPKT